MSTLTHLIRGGAIAAVVATCAWAETTPPATPLAGIGPVPPGAQHNYYVPKANFGTGAQISGMNSAPAELDPGITSESIGHWQARVRRENNTAAVQRRERRRGQEMTRVTAPTERNNTRGER